MIIIKYNNKELKKKLNINTTIKEIKQIISTSNDIYLNQNILNDNFNLKYYNINDNTIRNAINEIIEELITQVVILCVLKNNIM